MHTFPPDFCNKRTKYHDGRRAALRAHDCNQRTTCRHSDPNFTPTRIFGRPQYQPIRQWCDLSSLSCGCESNRNQPQKEGHDCKSTTKGRSGRELPRSIMEHTNLLGLRCRHCVCSRSPRSGFPHKERKRPNAKRKLQTQRD